MTVYPWTLWLGLVSSVTYLNDTALPEPEKLSTIYLSLIAEISAEPPLQHDGTYILDRQAINQLTNLVDALKNNPEIKIAISLPPATLSGISQSNNQKD